MNYRRERDLESNERTALIESGASSNTDAIFRPLLDRELKKICDFYELQERTLLGDASELEELVKMKEEEHFQSADNHYLMGLEDDEDDEDDDDQRAASRSRERGSGRGSSNNRRRRAISDSRAFVAPGR